MRLGRNTLKNIRKQKVGSCSDAELRDTLTRLTREVQGGASEHALPEVFAVVDEAISRRLGAWRLFDSAQLFDKSVPGPSFESFHNRADRISRGLDYGRALNLWEGQGKTCWESFESAVAPILLRHGLNPAERIIVGTILFVNKRSQVEYTADILLPASFYQTLRTQDTDGILTFQATDEQLLAGILLYQGKIVEMNAGEGKTVAAAFPAVLHAVHGRPVHIITANDYLASRDAEWLAAVYESLGLSGSAVLEFMEDSERRISYGKNIVYGALREFGFDFMRDNLKLSAAELVQRNLDVAIVDEADHAMIDEANMPLIIAGGTGSIPRIPAKLRTAIEQLVNLQQSVVSNFEQELEQDRPRSKPYLLLLTKLYLAEPESDVLRREFATDPKLLKRVLRTITAERIDEDFENMTRDLYYWIDDRGQSLCLTEKGQDYVESRLGHLFDDLALQEEISSIEANTGGLPLAQRRKEVNNRQRQLARRQDRMQQVVRMLWAYVLLKKNVDYLVRDDQVVLLDKYTGRGRPDTRFHYGLQAALEVKEGVPVQPENAVLGRISVRGFLSQYHEVSGMTGTAMSSKDEFGRSYGLDVVPVPPNKRLERTDLEPRLYSDNNDKLQAIVDEVRSCHQVGRPVLIGTHSIDECDAISQLLTNDSIEHNLLNAANDMEEELVIKQAGRLGAVTVATDMAGRGSDIILEPGLDRQIAENYAALVARLLEEGVGQVTLECPTENAADFLLPIIVAGIPDCSVATTRRVDAIEIIVSATGGSTGGSTTGSTVFMEFGLGLYVIGTESSDTARVDQQLKGRSGRQGAFGVSRFFLSSEDGLFKFHGDAAPASSTLVDAKSDSAGRTFWEGAPLTRRLENIRANAEKDAEARRALVEEYTRVFEAQSFAYYRTRKDILRIKDFLAFRASLVTPMATQMVQKYFPGLLVDDYQRQFAGLCEELDVDYKVDASDLWGVDLSMLEYEIALLIESSLERARMRFTDDEYGKLGKLLYLQTSDELWRDHISHIQSLILSAQLCGHNGRGDVATYTLTSFDSYDEFQNRIMDSFLPKLISFPGELTGESETKTFEFSGNFSVELSVELSEEVLQILA
ncbi:MAG: hypothetical protein BZY75_03885 [SAR202 cluster bacterium Io17-Chloro-G7]|nr:MAG: hypothetical protein BZY75_03885 [SAR202 cluster bacterium Io17-Chloro-G7]